jgi:hypothetical protein
MSRPVERKFDKKRQPRHLAEGGTGMTDHARLHCADSFVLRIVRNVRGAMEQLVDPVPTIRSDDTASILPRNWFT